MKSELIFSGIGGQGVILLGKLLCHAASKKGMNVTLAPAYGQEKRGGRTSCQVVMSDKVGSPVISEADTILVMDENSYDDYVGKVKKGGCLIINSSIVNRNIERDDIEVVKIPVSDLAMEIGNLKSSNMVALGAVVRTLNVLNMDDVKEVLKAKLKSSIVDVNIKALETGYNYK